MTMLHKLQLKTQLGAGLAAVVLLFLATLAVLGALSQQVHDGVQRVSEHSLPLVVALDRMDVARSEVQQFLTDVSATHDPAGYTEADASARKFSEAARAAREILARDAASAALQKLDRIEADFKIFAASGRRMAEAYLADGREAGNRLMKGHDGQPGFDAASAALLEQLEAFRGEQLEAAREDTTGDLRAADRMRTVMAAGGLLATVLATAVGLALVQRVLARLGGDPAQAVAVAERVGTGDLGTPIALRAGDDDSLLAHLAGMQQQLLHVVGTVRDRAGQLGGTSQVIAGGASDLSQRTASLAASLEEAAAAMEQLTTTVSQNQAGVRRAYQMADAVRDRAERGGSVVEGFVSTMEGIQQSSTKIAEIIGVIDGIAFQTNILALNAAVEAARAGEQGRGFAVVASEVRSLAGRSAEAARAVKDLINTSVERVAEGSQQVSEARSVMAEVVADIGRLSTVVGEIDQASLQQAAGVTQVAETVRRMNELTQRNSALVEDSATAARSLREQADALNAAVSIFRLVARETASAPPPEQARPTPALAV